jgi:hypothetical protein
MATPLKLFCRRGHKYTSKNERWRFNKTQNSMQRACRKCENLKASERYQKKKHGQKIEQTNPESVISST